MIALQSFRPYNNYMASITVRNIDEETKTALKRRAVSHGRSMEEEVRHILRKAASAPQEPENLARKIHTRFQEIGGWEIELEPRAPMRPLPFDWVRDE